MRDYLIIEPDSGYVTHYLRDANGWKKRIYDNLKDIVELSDIGVTLTLGKIYSDVT
jgi:Uma2 family endonuclease